MLAGRAQAARGKKFTKEQTSWGCCWGEASASAEAGQCCCPVPPLRPCCSPSVRSHQQKPPGCPAFRAGRDKDSTEHRTQSGARSHPPTPLSSRLEKPSAVEQPRGIKKAKALPGSGVLQPCSRWERRSPRAGATRVRPAAASSLPPPCPPISRQLADCAVSHSAGGWDQSPELRLRGYYPVQVEMLKGAGHAACRAALNSV